MKNCVLIGMMLALIAPVALAKEELVDNPAYKHWAAFKLGSTAKLVTTIKMEGEPLKSTVTQTLKELTAEKAVVEQAVEMTVQGHTAKRPGDTLVIMAKAPKDQAIPKPPMGGTATKKAEGDEELTVGEKKYKCHWEQYDVKGEMASGKMRVWTCSEVVGGLVKMQMDIEKTYDKPANGMSITKELIEFKPAR